MRFTIDITPRGFVFGLVLVSGLLGASYVARATPGGATKSKLSFAGTLRQSGMGIPGLQTLKFAFKKQGAVLCSPTATTTPDSQGAFTTEIDISTCPNLFDGNDVIFDVSLGGTLLQADVPVSPVPYAKYADAVNPNPDCPVTYARDTANIAYVICKNGSDEVVKVGRGPSAFWIDRYEASVWDTAAANGTQYGATGPTGLLIAPDYPATFPKNSQRTPTFKEVYAVSKVGVQPSASLTWFQAVEACAASGKRLPTSEEWQRAASGTNDPSSNNGTGGACVTASAGPGARSTGQGTLCVSAWGTQDMIGNVAEMTGDWYAGVGDLSAAVQAKSNWPDASYGGDTTDDIASTVYSVSGATAQNLPSVLVRGGTWGDGATAGVFNLRVSTAPSYSDHSIGFRCVAR